MDAIRFLIDVLLWLAILPFLLRVVLQLARADFRNQIAQAILRITNPLVLPLRRIIPPLGRIDLASIIALLLVQLAATTIVILLRGLGPPTLVVLLPLAIRALATTVLQFYWGALLIYVLLSWVAPGTYSPATAVLNSLCEPLLRPIRRIIPAIAGLDLSALFALIGLQALLILLR